MFKGNKMKKIIVAMVIIASLFVMKFVTAGSLASISPEEAFKLQTESKGIVIDVREPAEFNSGKVKGALTIPMSLMNDDRVSWDLKVNELNKSQTIILYCQSGRRAGIVGEEMVKKGYKVLNLGGLEAWKAKGLPTE